MINSVSDLLNEFIKAEVEVLNTQEIKHPTTIGSMFEGLTEHILNKSVFSELNLRVIKNSFIIGCKTEFDVLLVNSEGEKIPYTDRYQFKPDQVIVVIQVKKNIYGKDIKDSYENLKHIKDYYEDVENSPYMSKLFCDSFKAICRKRYSKDKESYLTKQEEYISHSLMFDAILPVRIVLGYNGYKSEYAFRNGLLEYISENSGTSGFAPYNFPNLMICNKFSLIKNNGMPFMQPLDENEWWNFYISSSYKASYYFLEIIWTRLSYMYNLGSDIFGEDLSVEPANKFLDCRIKQVGNEVGWEFLPWIASKEELDIQMNVEKWSPVFVDDVQHVIIMELCKYGDIDLINDISLNDFILKGNYSSILDFVQKLNSTGLTYVKDNKLLLLTEKCKCVILPDGRIAVADDKCGRFTHWLSKLIYK